MKLIDKYKYIFLLLIILLAGVLRFYRITEVPPGLYIDEAANAIDANYILTTGHDQFGNFMPLWFRSTQDYKMPLYIYAMSGAMAVFGKNEFAVRFPSALAGTLTVLVVYFLVYSLVSYKKNKSVSIMPSAFALLSAGLLAISPWHIQFSRGGFEVTLATFFYLLGFLLAIYYQSHRKFYVLCISFVIFCLSIYTYHTYRIITPLTMFSLALFFAIQHKQFLKSVIALFIAFIIILPVVFFSTTSDGLMRFSQTSAFEEYKTENISTMVTVYPLVFLKNYLSFFSLDYLFTFGDGIGRHQIPEFGGIPKWQLPFVLIGTVLLFRSKKSWLFYVLLFLILIAPIPAAFARPSPHALRGLLASIPWTIIAAYGVYHFLIGRKLMLTVLITCIALYEFIFYLHFYYIHYTNVNIMDWGGGYKQLMLRLNEISTKNNRIVFDPNLHHASIYYQFYGKGNQVQIKQLDYGRMSEEERKGILYVTPYYETREDASRFENIRLTNDKNDIFAQIWRY